MYVSYYYMQNVAIIIIIIILIWGVRNHVGTITMDDENYFCAKYYTKKEMQFLQSILICKFL